MNLDKKRTNDLLRLLVIAFLIVSVCFSTIITDILLIELVFFVVNRPYWLTASILIT
jgi:hypothetical protein